MRRFLIITLVLSTVAIGLVAYLLLKAFGRAFPELPPGVYAGTIIYRESGRVIPWLVDNTDPAKDLAVYVADEGIPAQRAPTSDPGGGTSLPLIVSGPQSRLRLIGSKVNERDFEGTFLNPITNEEGTWKLEQIKVPEISENMAADLQAWAILWREVQAVESRIETTQKKVDEQKGKIEKLNRYLVDEDSLRKKADSRLGATTGALEEARAQLAALRTELDATTRKVEVSQRVSAKGRLSLLGRETLQRESRWVELTLKLFAPETSPGFEQSLERANRVKALKDEISSERRRIAELQDAGRYQGEHDETRSEEEFYLGIQN